MAVSLPELLPNSRINVNTLSSIQNRSQFKNVIYQGLVGYSIADSLDGDVRALVAATKAYFRPGTSTDPLSISYVIIRETPQARPVVIPEPLLNLTTLSLVGNVVRTITVNDDIPTERLRSIMAGNGVNNFSIVETQL